MARFRSNLKPTKLSKQRGTASSELPGYLRDPQPAVLLQKVARADLAQNSGSEQFEQQSYARTCVAGEAYQCFRLVSGLVVRAHLH